MAGKGGARAGAGAKKGQHRVHVQELREAIERHVGMKYQDILGITYLKLFNDFQAGNNVKEYITFNENMNKRILEQPVQEIEMSNPLQELSQEDIKARIAKLVAAEKAEPEVEADEELDKPDQEVGE